MNFFHYKEYPPINLDKVGTIGKENQQIAPNAVVYAIGFFEFERKLGYWVFQSEEERNEVFELLRKQISRELVNKQVAQGSHAPARARV